MGIQNLQIPWKMFYTLDTKELDGRENVVIISPVTRWANAVEPGDEVELCQLGDMKFLGLYSVLGAGKGLLWHIPEEVLRFWRPGATLNDLRDHMINTYGTDITDHSVVAVIFLHKLVEGEKPYEKLLKTD